MASISEFGGFSQETMNSINGIEVSFQIAETAALYDLCTTSQSSWIEDTHFLTYNDKTEHLYEAVLNSLSSDDKSIQEIKSEIIAWICTQYEKKSKSGNHRKGLSQDTTH